MFNLKDQFTLLGNFSAELGVGEASRRLRSLLVSSGALVNVQNLHLTKSRSQAQVPHLEAVRRESRSHLVSCVNADQTLFALAEGEIDFDQISSHTGFWSWELPDFPRQYAASADLMDEIWTVSDFCRKSISKSITKKVRRIKLPVPVPNHQTHLTRSHFGIAGNAFLVTVSFDYFSDFNRKNPMAAIDAYLAAFEPGDNATLIVKCINANPRDLRHQQILDISGSRKDIKILDTYLDGYENLALIELSDVYLSLHRAEGYGLNLADAMARKTAVVATGYSGNLDFMTTDNSILIPYEEVNVRHYAGHQVNSSWAEPSNRAASASLRELFEDRQLLEQVSRAGRSHILSHHSLGRAAESLFEEFQNG